MFRSKNNCERYEEIPIQLDTPITLPVNGARQSKTGHNFTMNDRSSYFDWYNAYFMVGFVVNKLADGGAFGAGDRIAMINNAASLINQLTVKQNGKMIYDCNNLHRFVNVKTIIEMSKDYIETTGTDEFIYPDTSDTAEHRSDQAGYNIGFAIRKGLIQGGNLISVRIPLNRFSFFEALEQNMLPPSQIQIGVQLTDDNELIFKHGADDARVVVKKLELWVPRMEFNSKGIELVAKNYMKPTKWTYLREMIQESGSSQQIEQTFRITSGVKTPKHVFIYLQRTDKSGSQTQNPHLLDTFKLNAADTNCSLQSARLEVGNGVFYPETEYSSNDMSRIFKDVLNYTYKTNDKNTGSLLNRSNFESLFGLVYFNLEYQKEDVTNDPKQLTLRCRLNTLPTARYKIYALVMYDEDVVIDSIGNELIII